MTLRPRQRLGQYRIVRRLAAGGFAEVYEAYDTVEGIPVALKVPDPTVLDREGLEGFRKEVRFTARLDHPNILPIKTAGMVDGRFVVVQPLGKESLEDRLRRRLSHKKVLHYARQMLDALAHAHGKHVIHCDLKPDNLILFPDDRLRLADFGLAKVAVRSLRASGSGTIGYVAPEQVFGRPSPRSDVFSAGLILWRMVSGQLPEYPYRWPFPGLDRVRRAYHPDLIALVRKACEFEPKKRFSDARAMRNAFLRVLPRALRTATNRRRRTQRAAGRDWRQIRLRQFQREFGKLLDTRHECGACGGPVSEAMLACPWCGRERKRHRGGTRRTHACPRCKRGLRADWRFCPWCWGPAVGPFTARRYPDPAYERRCKNPACERREMLPFQRYCPWCRHKTRHAWPIPGVRKRCPRCRWGVLPEYWSTCPWCAKHLGHGIQPVRAR